MLFFSEPESNSMGIVLKYHEIWKEMWNIPEKDRVWSSGNSLRKHCTDRRLWVGERKVREKHFEKSYNLILWYLWGNEIPEGEIKSTKFVELCIFKVKSTEEKTYNWDSNRLDDGHRSRPVECMNVFLQELLYDCSTNLQAQHRSSPDRLPLPEGMMTPVPLCHLLMVHVINKATNLHKGLSWQVKLCVRQEAKWVRKEGEILESKPDGKEKRGKEWDMLEI